MDIQYVHIPNARLTKGAVYPFRILKTVSLGPEDDYFVLEDPNGYKILLNKPYFEGYGFEPGQKIDCKVDKVNCNGKVFLEPIHPFYREGESYFFDFVCKDGLWNILNQEERFFIIRDRLEKEWKVRIHDQQVWDNPPKRIKCLVIRIKKGKLYLQASTVKQPVSRLRAGQRHTFLITDERHDPMHKATYYILTDQNGCNHMLKKKHYIRYGLKTGDKVTCLIRQVAADGFLILEPQHPCYVTGKSYQFPVDRMEEMVFTDGYRQKVLVLQDCFGEEVKLHVDDRTAQLLASKRYIQAKVKEVVKGKPELEISDEQPI